MSSLCLHPQKDAVRGDNYPEFHKENKILIYHWEGKR